jgi:hypothetical protein
MRKVLGSKDESSNRAPLSVAFVARAIALLAILLLAGCGGTHQKNRVASDQEGRQGERTGEARSETEELQRALLSIPHADRRAFIQIGIATGDLNGAASLLSVNGIVRRRDTIALRRLRPRVARLRPRDRQLARLRARLLIALDREIRARRNPSSASRYVAGILAIVHQISYGLKRYEASHPTIRALIPD